MQMMARKLFKGAQFICSITSGAMAATHYLYVNRSKDLSDLIMSYPLGAGVQQCVIYNLFIAC